MIRSAVGRLFDGLRRQWIGALAIGLLLTGSTAYALEGSNTVFSDDIVNAEVRTGDVRNQAVTTAKLAPAAVTRGKVAAKAIGEAQLSGIELLRAHTARLVDDAPGGASDSEQMLTVGRVTLNGFCAKQESGRLIAGVSPVVEESGAVLVTESDTVPLVPFDVQFVILVGTDAGIAAEQTSFAILDGEQTSATGVAAASVDHATSECVVSMHAVG